MNSADKRCGAEAHIMLYWTWIDVNLGPKGKNQEEAGWRTRGWGVRAHGV